MKKPRLVYILHDIQVGGVEVALISAIPTLYRDYDLTVLALGQIDPEMIVHLSDAQRSCFYKFNYPLLIFPVSVFRIVAYILKRQPDIVVSSLWRASLVGLLVKKANPAITFISFVHSTTFFHKCDEIFTRAAIRRADRVFTDSSATSDFVLTHSNFQPKTTVISFFIKESPAQKISHRPGADGARFMFLGRLSKVKNLTLTVDAIGHLHSRGLNVSLDIYGPDGGELKDLLLHIENHDLQSIIKYHGAINADQKAIAFREHHFLIQLSSNEGMAMSVAEAMQNGLVCFITPVGEIKNYAADMETAVFANIWNPKEWQKSLLKIEELIHNPDSYNNISANCFQHFRSVETYAHSLSKAIFSHYTHENHTRSHIS